MQKIFMIGDPHFGDNDIIRYENRPFDSVHKMDQALIENWNNIICSNIDKIYICGDFAHPTLQPNDIRHIVSKLRGEKILILGNHDRHFTPKE